MCLPELSYEVEISVQEVVNILGKSRDKIDGRTVLQYFRILTVSLSAHINKALIWVKIIHANDLLSIHIWVVFQSKLPVFYYTASASYYMDMLLHLYNSYCKNLKILD